MSLCAFMKPVPRNLRILRVLLLLLALAVVPFLSGCATQEPENQAELPWNTPTGWESGLPAGMMQGH